MAPTAAAGYLEQTVLVFAADHGETFGEHGVHGHAHNAPTEKDDENAARRFHPVAPGSEFLFDRRVDPGENVNLVGREPTEAGRMRNLLDAHLTDEGAGVVERGVRIDPGIADRLRAMGYLR